MWLQEGWLGDDDNAEKVKYNGRQVSCTCYSQRDVVYQTKSWVCMLDFQDTYETISLIFCNNHVFQEICSIKLYDSMQNDFRMKS